MLAKITSAATAGLAAVPIEVEVDVASRGLPSLSIVGLPDKAVEEAKERVRAALHNSGIDFPPRRITINLAPADIPKEGPAYDLPIALGILLASGTIEADLANSLFVGELSLDVTVRYVHGVLPMAIMAREEKLTSCFVPIANASEAAVVSGITVLPVASIKQLINHLTGVATIEEQSHRRFEDLKQQIQSDFDMVDVHGQETAKRALEIAAAGGHNMFMRGVPGSGKTMLARTFPTILPDLTEEEAFEVSKIYSISGQLPIDQALILERPFRSPHHTTSRVGLIGGGSQPKPGEISLAHRGVLFLDEFPEFPRHVLEGLRQPIEDGVVSISWAAGSMQYPSKFCLIAAANPCPCGYYTSKKRACICSAGDINRYQKKVSGPILDRIDLHVEVPEVEVDKLTAKKATGEVSVTIKERVERARRQQRQRLKKTRLLTNAEMSTKQVKIFCQVDDVCRKLLTQAVEKLGLSARSYFKTIKVARTIADLAGEKEISLNHVAEALSYRPSSVFG